MMMIMMIHSAVMIKVKLFRKTTNVVKTPRRCG